MGTMWTPLKYVFEFFEAPSPGWDPGRPWAGSKALNYPQMKSLRWILADVGEDFYNGYDVVLVSNFETFKYAYLHAPCIVSNKVPYHVQHDFSHILEQLDFSLILSQYLPYWLVGKPKVVPPLLHFGISAPKWSGCLFDPALEN